MLRSADPAADTPTAIDAGYGMTCAVSGARLAGWETQEGAADRCVPGSDVTVGYAVSYTKRGWAAPERTVSGARSP